VSLKAHPRYKTFCFQFLVLRTMAHSYFPSFWIKITNQHLSVGSGSSRPWQKYHLEISCAWKWFPKIGRELFPLSVLVRQLAIKNTFFTMEARAIDSSLSHTHANYGLEKGDKKYQTKMTLFFSLLFLILFEHFFIISRDKIFVCSIKK